MQITEHFNLSDAIDSSIAGSQRSYRGREPSTCNASISSSKRFTGTDSYAEALGLARKGDQVALARIDAIARKHKTSGENESIGLTMVQDVVGSCVNVGLFLEGQPECFTDFQINSGKRRVVTFLVNISASCGVSAEKIDARGSVIMEAVRCLELAGYSVGLSVCEGIKRNDHRMVTMVKIKEPGQYLDPAVTSFWLVHPSSLRRMFFGIQENHSDEIRDALDINYTYGIPADLEKNEIPDDCVYLKHITRESNDRSVLEKEIEKLLLERGIVFKFNN